MTHSVARTARRFIAHPYSFLAPTVTAVAHPVREWVRQVVENSTFQRVTHLVGVAVVITWVGATVHAGPLLSSTSNLTTEFIGVCRNFAQAAIAIAFLSLMTDYGRNHLDRVLWVVLGGSGVWLVSGIMTIITG